jgi:hypothetical protein
VKRVKQIHRIRVVDATVDVVMYTKPEGSAHNMSFLIRLAFFVDTGDVFIDPPFLLQ